MNSAQPRGVIPMDFVAIDFETANSNRSSICAIGLAIVQSGQLIGSQHMYVRPQPYFFDPFNVSIHGITEAMVKDAPRFSELWPSVRSGIGAPLVAHNASFDMSALRYVLDASHITYPQLDYFCTRVISRIAWPDRPTYRLNYIAEMLDIQFRHHNAEQDAIACARIAIAACRHLGAESLYALAERSLLRKGRLFPGGYSPCGVKSQRKTGSLLSRAAGATG